MANIKTVDWEELKNFYVMSNKFPSYDEVAKKYGISKPLVMSFANNRDEVINQGKTWIELRAEFRDDKSSKSDSEEALERKAQTKKSISVMRQVQDGMFELISEDLSQLFELQQEAKANGQRFDITKYVRISDFIKLSETIDSMSKPKQNQSAPISITFKESEKKQLEDMTDDELRKLEFQVGTEIDD